MNANRRSLVVLALATSLGGAAIAQQYPNHPIKLVVPFPAGTASDNVGRMLANALSASMGQPVIVDNRPGADSAIGAAAVANAAPDGYTLLLATNGFAALPAMRKTLPFDSLKSFTPISFVSRFALYVYVNSDVPTASLDELLAYARANPGKLNYATGNPTGIVAMAQLLSMAGNLQMTHVPYKGEPAGITDLITNRVQVMIATPGSAESFVREGKLKALATTLPSRAATLPNVPSLNERFPKFSVVAWAALMGPAGMPKDVTEKLSREVAAALSKPELKQQFARNQYFEHSSSPEDFKAYLTDQLELYARVLKEAGVEPQ